MRRTIMRYVCLGLTMVFANISPRVKKRFPTLDHYVEAGMYLIFNLYMYWLINNNKPILYFVWNIIVGLHNTHTHTKVSKM